MKHIVESLSNHPRNLVFFLWGLQAQKWEEHIKDRHRHLILKTSHPSPKSVKMGFEGCNHFEMAEAFIQDNYLDVRSAIDSLQIEKLLLKFAKEKNITFDMNESKKFKFGLFIPGIENKTRIELALE